MARISRELTQLTGQLTRLFNPRRDLWPEHFRYDGPVFVGLTDIGRTTVAVLAVNRASQVAARQALIDDGVFRPMNPEQMPSR